MSTLFRKTQQSTLLAASLLLLCAILVWTDISTPRLQPLRQGVFAAVEPIILVAHAPGKWIDSLRFLVSTYLDQFEAIEQLERENFRLAALSTRIVGLAAENNRLRALLGSTDVIEANALIAEVLSVERRSDHHRLILDKGQRDGVRVGQAVIDETGLLGQVVQVMPGLAQVMLITDAGHAVPLVNERSGQQFVAEGIGDRQQLSVRFISPSTNLQIGDVLITSGLGRRFPRGYPVGEIVSITPIEGDAFVDVRLAISARPESVDHALVLFLSEGSQKIDIDIQAIDQAGSL